MVIAGLDIATTTGCCILDGDRLVVAGAFRFEGDCTGQIFRNCRTTLAHLIVKYSIKYVAAEEPLRTDIELSGKKNEDGTEGPKTRPQMSTFQRIYGLCAVAEEVCFAHDVNFRYVHQGTWRRSFTGSGRATKEQSLAYAKLVDPSITSLDAAEAMGVAWWLRGELNPRYAAARGDLFEQPIQPKKETPF